MERRFVELIIEGPERHTRDWVRGFLAARAADAEVLFEGEAGFAADTLLEEIKERLHLTHAATRTIAAAEAVSLVREAAAAEHERGIKITAEREIESASFEYRFEIYNREMGEAFQRAIGERPAGVELCDHQQSLQLDDHGEPVPFAPAHRYEFHGKGRAEGAVDKIVQFRKELAGFGQVTVEPIRLKYRTA